MKIALINGSPKQKNSTSQYLLNELKGLLSTNNNHVEVSINNYKIIDETLNNITDCDALVFAFPLYVDGIPSHFLSFLEVLAQYYHDNNINKPILYPIINCGFFEPSQNKIALDMIKLYALKHSFTYGVGTGIGGGGMLQIESIPLHKGPKKDLGKGLTQLSSIIEKKEVSQDIYISPNFPRFLYIHFAHIGWKKTGKNNGLTLKQIKEQK